MDYALPISGGQGPDLSGDDASSSSSKKFTFTPIKRMRYSHFGCNVVHEDLAYPLGVDTHKAKFHFKKQVEKSLPLANDLDDKIEVQM